MVYYWWAKGQSGIRPLCPLHVLPAEQYISRVEPRGFEPLTSAVQRRCDSLLECSRACKIPANRRILPITHFSTFQEIYSGCCTVAAQTVRLHPHKVRDDRYSTNRLEAIFLSFVLGAIYKVPGLRACANRKVGSEVDRLMPADRLRVQGYCTSLQESMNFSRLLCVSISPVIRSPS